MACSVDEDFDGEYKNFAGMTVILRLNRDIKMVGFAICTFRPGTRRRREDGGAFGRRRGDVIEGETRVLWQGLGQDFSEGRVASRRRASRHFGVWKRVEGKRRRRLEAGGGEVLEPHAARSQSQGWRDYRKMP